MSKILRLPGSTLSAEFAAGMDLVGYCGIRLITASCLGALSRTATTGRLSWQPLLGELVDRADALLPARRAMIDNSPWPDVRCAPGFVATLQRASAGSVVGDQPNVKVAAAAAAAASHTVLRKKNLLAPGLQAAAVVAFHSALFAPLLAEAVIPRWTRLTGILPQDVFRQRMSEF